MHSLLLVLGVAIAVLSRQLFTIDSLKLREKSWIERWYWSLGLFLVPPLFLGMMAIAIVTMGHHGQMLGHSVSWMACHVVLGLGSVAFATLLWQALQSLYSIYQICQLPTRNLAGQTVRALETPLPFAGRIGLWNAELVLSQNLPELLNSQELKAVLLHEQAHLRYQDTFWFFWLGWVRRITAWLPQTRELWQELLLLRELRADTVAVRSVDPIVLAEALFKVVQASSTVKTSHLGVAGAYFSDEPSRLETRIEAILDSTQSRVMQPQAPSWNLRLGFAVGVMASVLPLLANVFHSAM